MAGPIPVLVNGQSSNVGIRDTGSTASLTVGTKGILDDGRVFYYARNSGIAIVAGQLLTQELASVENDDLACNTAALGATSVLVTPGTVAQVANAFAEGYMVINDDTSEGLTYKISGHDAISASTEFTLNLREPLLLVFGAGTTVTLVKNPWADVVIAPTAQAHICAGISQVAVAAGSSTVQFFWCQTWGMTCCESDAASGIGTNLMSGATAGRSETATAIGDQNIGVQVSVGVDNEFNAIFLTIAP